MKKQTQAMLGIALGMLSIFVLLLAAFALVKPGVVHAVGTTPPTPTSTVAATQFIHYHALASLPSKGTTFTDVGSQNFYSHAGAAQISATVIASPTPGVQTYTLDCVLDLIEPGNAPPFQSSSQKSFTSLKGVSIPNSVSPYTIDARAMTIGSPISSILPLGNNAALLEGTSNVGISCITTYVPKTASAPQTLSLEVNISVIVGSGASSVSIDTVP